MQTVNWTRNNKRFIRFVFYRFIFVHVTRGHTHLRHIRRRWKRFVVFTHQIEIAHFIRNFVGSLVGFRAEGAHLPTSPPIPEAIAKSLQYIRSVQPQQIGYTNQNQFSQNQQAGYQKWASRTAQRQMQWVVRLWPFPHWNTICTHIIDMDSRLLNNFMLIFQCAPPASIHNVSVSFA